MADPVFTSDQIKQDATNRVAKTTGQVGGATALVGLGQALCQSRGWLHGELDAIVFGYWVTLITVALSGLTNLGRFRGKG